MGAFHDILWYTLVTILFAEVIMEKFKLFVEYQVAKTTYVTNLFETEHFRMHCKAFRDHIKLTMQTPIPCASTSCKSPFPIRLIVMTGFF